MITVACVYRTGGVYTREWVWALKRGLSRHLTDFRFACLTNDASVEPYWRIPLTHDWPGWWSKMECFRPGLFDGPVLYCDLDTLPVGDLSDLASYRGPFAMLSDFYQPRLAQSGVMAFTPGDATARIWERFIADSVRSRRQHRGDGEFLHAHAKPDRLQDLYPGQIVSLKAHARKGSPSGARLVCGHGKPRFSDPAAGWAHEYWRTMTVTT